MAETHDALGIPVRELRSDSDDFPPEGEKPLLGNGRHVDGLLGGHGVAHLQESLVEPVVTEAAIAQRIGESRVVGFQFAIAHRLQQKRQLIIWGFPR